MNYTWTNGNAGNTAITGSYFCVSYGFTEIAYVPPIDKINWA